MQVQLPTRFKWSIQQSPTVGVFLLLLASLVFSGALSQKASADENVVSARSAISRKPSALSNVSSPGLKNAIGEAAHTSTANSNAFLPQSTQTSASNQGRIAPKNSTPLSFETASQARTESTESLNSFPSLPLKVRTQTWDQ